MWRIHANKQTDFIQLHSRGVSTCPVYHVFLLFPLCIFELSEFKRKSTEQILQQSTFNECILQPMQKEITNHVQQFLDAWTIITNKAVCANGAHSSISRV